MADGGLISYKGVAIDGANLWNMMRVNGSEQTNFLGLFHVVEKRIGVKLPFAEKPRCTIRPEYFGKKGKGLYVDMCKAGFQPKAVESFREADDQRVKIWLHRYASWQHVSDIVLASCDGDIIDELLWLGERRMKQGQLPMRIDVIGTCTPDADGCCKVCSEVLEALEACPYGFFHDIKNYQTEVSFRSVH